MLYPDKEMRTLRLEEANRRRHEDYSSVWDLQAKDGTLRTVEWFNVGARRGRSSARSRVSLQISDDGRGLGSSAASTKGMGMRR